MEGRGTGRDSEGDDASWRAPSPPAARRGDYAGAVYGSLLAASVVMTAGTVGRFPRLQLFLLLLITGLVFWMAHVYARLVGERLLHASLTKQEIRRVAVHEWPIVKVAVPPALAVAISPLLRLGLQATVWFALAVAVAEQVGWATLSLVRAGASRRMVLVSGAVNLLLGAVIVVAKAALSH